MLIKRRRVFGYLLLPMAVIFLLLSLSVAFLSFRNIRSLIYAEYDKRLESSTEVLRAGLPADMEALRRQAVLICERFGDQRELRITFIDTEGRVFADTHEDPAIMENHAGRLEVRKALRGEASFSTRRSPTLSREMLYYGSPLRDSNGEITAVLRTSIMARSIEEILSSAGLSVFLISLALLLLSVTSMVTVSRKISLPLSRIARSAADYADIDFSTPISIEGPREIASTAEALQKMASALTSRIAEVSKQKQELEAVVSGMNEAVIVLDGQMVISELNKAAAALIGRCEEAIIGKSLIRVIRNTELDHFVRKLLSEGGSGHCSLVLPGEKTDIHLQVKGSVIETTAEGGEGRLRPGRLVLVLNDISTLKRLEQIRKDFVANVSHELKTPITSIKGFVETLLDGAIEDVDTARRFLTIIQNQTSRLDDIIEDLLTLSRLERSREQGEPGFEVFSLASAVDEALSICRPRAEAKSIEIRAVCGQDLRIRGNPRLIEQTVVNLIDNAVKYCPAETTVLVSCKKGEAGAAELHVRDNGPGIPSGDHERIFERFYRVEKARDRELGGTGLGLAIVKHIMLLHRGGVELRSRPGEGSTFVLSFPEVQPEQG